MIGFRDPPYLEGFRKSRHKWYNYNKDMTVNLKTPVFIFLVLLFFLISSGFIFARELEVPLPGISQTPLLPDYVKYIFNFTIGIGGFVVFMVLVYGGVRYLTSAGNPSAMSDAKDRIFSALLGMIFLLGSWLILTTINPQLVIVSPEYKPVGLVASELPGVYLCKDAASQVGSAGCQVFTGSAQSLGGLDDKAAQIRFLNTQDATYGAILHENKNYEGTCKVATSEGTVNLPNGKPSSITVFRQRTGDGAVGATVYEDKDYGRGYYDFRKGEYLDIESVIYNNCTSVSRRTCLLKQSISSVKVYNGFTAVLFGDINLGGKCQALQRDNPGLADDYIGDDQASSIMVLPVQ